VADSRDQIQAIRERADIVEIVQQYVALRPAGKSFKGLCPFHTEKTPSFQVNPEKGLWWCFGACSTGGDVFSFIQKVENLSFPEAAEKLARRYGLPFDRGARSPEQASERERLFRVNALALRFFREQYERAPHVQAYAARRGLSSETVEQFRLGYAPASWDRLTVFLQAQRVPMAEAERVGLVSRGQRGYVDRFRNRLIFPILDVQDRPVAFGGRAMEEDGPKYLNSPETPIFIKGKTLYGLSLARKAIQSVGYAVVVEGYMDLIACHQAGFTQVVATLGTAITSEAVRVLRQHAAQLVLAYDGDSAGLGAALRSAPMFEQAGCEVRIARLPSGSDPDSVIKEEGAAAFQRLLDEAEPLIDYHLGRLAEQADLSTEDGRLAFIREAVRVIAGLKNTVTREHHRGRFEQRIRKLAEQWHPADVARAEAAERALRLELQRAWNSAARRTPVRADEFDGEAGAPPAAPVRPPSGELKAEALLLGAALTEARWAGRIDTALQEWLAQFPAAVAEGPPSSSGLGLFQDARHRCVAAAILGHTEGWEARLQCIWAKPELTEVVSGILVKEEGPPLQDAQVEGALSTLVQRWKRRRKKELEPEILQGRIGKNDELYQEYLQLVSDLGGQGLKGEG
jgi:DNA primase catalytic core